MHLHEILTEKISRWEEGLVAALFLNTLSAAELKIEEESRKRIELYLGVLRTLPWAYAREICYSISKGRAIKAC